MSILTSQFLLPTHVAWPIRASQEASEPREAGACLLLAAHRWMRLRIGVRVGFVGPRITSRRFNDLLAALKDATDADAQLVEAAGRFLDPAALCLRKDEDTAALVTEIETALTTALSPAVTFQIMTTGPGLPGRVLAWRGPGGHATGPGDLDTATATTWLATGDETPRAVGPASAGNGVALPLLPCPAPGDYRWFECPRGALYDATGKRTTPLGLLTPGRVLGRLLAWGSTREGDGAALATRLADAGMIEAAAELWIASANNRPSGFDAQTVAAARAFFAQHHIAGLDDDLDAWLLREMDASEARLREAGDLRGLTETLLARQQIETGNDRARTIRRVANLFREHLGDPESAAWCLLSHIEEHPDDEATLDEVVESIPSINRPEEAAVRLVALATQNSGARRARLALVAATAWQAAGRTKDAVAALEVALTGDLSDEATLAKAFELAGDDADARIRLLALRRDAAHAPDARAQASAERAALLATYGLVEESLAEWRRALDAAPDQIDAFDALVNAALDGGDPKAALSLAEEMAGRLVNPGPRAHVLRRLAALLGTDESAAARTESVLAEALALEPGHPELTEKLADLYAERGAWQAHLALLGRVAAAVPERAVETWMRMADVAVDHMDDSLAALGFLAAAAARDPEDPAPRRRIEALHERLGLWAEVARDLERHVQAGGAGRLAALLRLADVYEQRLSLHERTKETLWMALQEAPPEVATDLARRLAELHRADGERGRELDALAVAVRLGTDDEQTADLLVSMGRRALEPPADPITARAYLEQALKLNPIHPEAVELACDLWLASGQPERVVGAVEPLARVAADDEDTVREARLRRLAGEAAARCDEVDAALTQFKRVVELAPDDLVTRTRLGRLLARRGRHEEAMKVLAECLDQGQACPDRNELLLVAAGCAMEAAEPLRALAWLEAIDDGASPDLALLRRRIDAAAAANAHTKEVVHLEALAAHEAAGPARFTCLMRLGDLHHEALDDPATAMRWYQTAAAEGVSVKAALHKALGAAVAADERHEALAILQSMIAIEPDGHAQARLHHASALLASEVDEAERARAHLMKAVDLDPDFAEAVDALDASLAEDPAERAALLERLARHQRLAGQVQRLADTLRRLGTLFLELHNPARAADVLRQVLEQAPDDLNTRAALADTLTRIPGREADALEAHRGLVTMDPTRVESYRTIRDLCRLAKDEDGAWCAAGALSVLGQATDEERTAYAQRRQPTLRLRRDTLPTDGFVRWIRDEDDTDNISRVLALLYEPLSNLLPPKQPADLGLSEANRMDMGGRTPLAGMAQAAARVFGVRLPRVYHAPGRVGLAKVAFFPPALVVGDDVINAWRGKELRFALGRAVVAFAPGYELTGVSSAAGIRLFFLAALRMAFPDYPMPPDVEGIDEMAAGLSRQLSPAASTELRDVLTRFRQAQRAIDINAFLEGLDRAASRAGLFLANDIEVAAALLQEDTLSLSELEYGDQLVDLCAWSVSLRHAELRHAMLKPFGD